MNSNRFIILICSIRHHHRNQETDVFLDVHTYLYIEWQVTVETFILWKLSFCGNFNWIYVLELADELQVLKW